MKLSLNIKPASILNVLKKHTGSGLWAFLAIIFLMASWVMYQEWQKISLVNSNTSGITGQIVRVNIQQHQGLERRLDENARFVPQAVPGADAFSVAPANAPQ